MNYDDEGRKYIPYGDKYKIAKCSDVSSSKYYSQREIIVNSKIVNRK